MNELSNFEIEVMHLFWEAGELTAPEAHERVASERDVAYTTVKTIIDRLEQKGALKRVRTYGRTIVYAPLIKKEAMAKRHLQRFIDTVFKGRPRDLFATLFNDDQLSLDDLSYLESLLKEKDHD
ncbi:MAG: BlaI/MecI/CopY family transcriptional regulator [Acidobacteria bacterium]|nr:BlaI/MecI/CopY family transcriptional regulator [Acidobacteriota bacterium]